MALFIIITIFLALAAGFAMYLVNQDKGEREPIKALWAAFGFGALGTVAAVFLELWLLPNVTNHVVPLSTLAFTTFGIGVIEECAKALPLIFFIYRKRYFNEHTDGVIYFGLAGLGFGLPENILYTLQFGAKAGIARIALTPLFHAATTAVIGYALIRCKLDKQPKLRVIKVVTVVALLHGFYDFGLMSGVGILQLLAVAVTVAFTVNLFVIFKKAKALDEQQGLSVVGNNSFCRTCGHPNPKHNLYCSRCGNRA